MWVAGWLVGAYVAGVLRCFHVQVLSPCAGRRLQPAAGCCRSAAAQPSGVWMILGCRPLSPSPTNASPPPGLPAAEGEEETAQLHIRKVAHTGGINRVRACPQQPHIVASFADTAQVQVCLGDRQKGARLGRVLRGGHQYSSRGRLELHLHLRFFFPSPAYVLSHHVLRLLPAVRTHTNSHAPTAHRCCCCQVWDLSVQLGDLKDEVAPVAGAQGKVHKVAARHVHTHSSGK